MSFYPLMQSSRVQVKSTRIIIRGLEYDTYEGWRKRKYQVQRGQRSYMKDIEGTSLFSEEQVKEIESYSTQPHWSEEDDDDHGCSQWDLF